MSLLTPDSGLLFWMILSFGIVLVVLSKYGFPVIIKAVEQRKAYIEGALDSARKANEQLANLKAEGETIIAQAKEQQNAILKEAMMTKEQIIAEARQLKKKILHERSIKAWCYFVDRFCRCSR